MQGIALVIIAAASLWIVGVAFLMALRPGYCLRLFARMSASLEASSRRVQFTEQGLRVLAGVALVVRAPVSKVPVALEIFGWLLIASSILVMAAPIRWHGTYGRWWVERLRPWMIRALSPLPAAVGAGLIYAAI